MTFEPFSVQCLTCGSRLRVSDPNIVGTIATCPRCQSMVQVERPGNQIAVGASDVDSQAITEEAIPAPSEGEFDAPATEAFAGGEDLESDSPANGLEPPAWQSDRTQRTRQVALVVALSVSGLLAAILFFGWFVRNWQRSPAVAEVEVAREETAEVGPADEVVEPNPAPNGDSDPPPPGEGQQAEPGIEASVGQPAGPPPIDHEKDAAGSPDQPAIPADLQPESPIVRVPQADPEGAADDAEPLLELPEGLKPFRDLLEIAGPNDLIPKGNAPPTLEDIDIDSAAQSDLDPLLVTAPLEKLDMNSDLSIPLAFDARGRYRFSDLMLLVGQLTGVPIQIDWVSFDLVGFDVHQPIEIPKTGLQPAKELLRQVCEQVGAQLEPGDYLLTVTANDETFDARFDAITTLDDFANGQPSAEATLGSLLPIGLKAAATREEKQFAMLAVDTLRRMRELKPAIPNHLAAHWAQISPDQLPDWPLLVDGQPVPQRHEPVTVAGWTRQIANRNACSCVFYWPDAIARRLSPAQLLIPRAEPHAGASLDWVLREFGLQVRRVDDRRWWIGSAATYDRASVLVWTKPLGENAAAFQQRLETVFGARERESFRHAFDSASGRIIMLLPRYLARQLPRIADSLVVK